MKKLTEKQLAFCQEYVNNGYNGSAAYRVAYEQDNNDVCKAEAYKMIRLLPIQEGIKNAELDYRITGHGLGINKEAICKVLKEAMDAKKTLYDKGEVLDTCPDHKSRISAVETYAKLVGDFAAEKKEVRVDDTPAVDVTKMTPEERETYKAKILAEL